MVKKRHDSSAPEIMPVAWRSRRPDAEVEVLHMADVLPRIPRDHMERIQFHVLALYLRGRCEHEVDFVSHRCRPGTVVFVRPGQVQRWRLQPGVDGLALVWKPAFLFPERPRAGAPFHERFFEDVSWPAALSLSPVDTRAAREWMRRTEQVAADPSRQPLIATLLRHLVSALLLDIARRAAIADAPDKEAPDVLHRARTFRVDVERSFRVTRSVLDYAQRQKCSARTLERTCTLVYGQSAKAFVDARVVLEAKRLLAHTTLTVAAIGEELGFSEPTNFVKFFKSRAGELPGAFRAAHQR